MTVYVYRNLRVKTRVEWVIADKPEAKKAWRRSDHITIADVSFKLSEASRQRCLRNKANPASKYGWDVHAFAAGIEITAADRRPGIEISYDKYGCGFFIRKDTRAPIDWCECVEFCADGRVIARGAIR